MTELADVFNQFGDQYIEKYKLSPEQYQVFNAISSCRSSKQGGYVDVCDQCGHLLISYNSCRNRYCPKCQGLKTEVSKPSFKDPKFVIEYLGRYTNKVAIANQRIIKIKGDKATFKYKDYSDNNRIKVMSIRCPGIYQKISPACPAKRTGQNMLLWLAQQSL